MNITAVLFAHAPSWEISKTDYNGQKYSFGRTISWTDLNIHMIEAHGFFEGKGSFFRIEPIELQRFCFGT
jgi:hypothetical protein